MKHLLILIVTFISSVSFGQQISYSNWQKEAQSNIRLLPKYGGVVKTKEQKEADEELIKMYVAQAGTPRKASELLVKLGFDYLYKNDLKTAMYRFNQAWLLDPKNENVYWGFGAIYFTFQDFVAASKQYEEGLRINPNSSNIITDQATIYLTQFNTNNNANNLASAIKLFRKSYSIDPKNQNTLIKMSNCYFIKNDCKNAWRYYNECKRLGGKPITEEYTAALTQKCTN